MVVLHIKRDGESQFLYNTVVTEVIDPLISDLVKIFNGRLKVQRLCSEMEDLAKHGVYYPPAMQGLTPDQVVELKLCDEWGQRYLTGDSYINNPDPIGRRNGKAPNEKLQEVITKTTAEAKAKISKKLVEANKCITYGDIQDALDMLRGSVMIAYPMGLPKYDPVREELDEVDCSAQVSHDMLDPAGIDLWWAGKQFDINKKLCDYVGRNEKSKIVIKLQKKGYGAPAREPVITDEQQKLLMLAEHRRREELKKLEETDDDSYLDSSWADNKTLQKSFQGLTNIRFH